MNNVNNECLDCVFHLGLLLFNGGALQLASLTCMGTRRRRNAHWLRNTEALEYAAQHAGCARSFPPPLRTICVYVRSCPASISTLKLLHLHHQDHHHHGQEAEEARG